MGAKHDNFTKVPNKHVRAEQMPKIHKITKYLAQILSKILIDSDFVYFALTYQSHRLNSPVYKNKVRQARCREQTNVNSFLTCGCMHAHTSFYYQRAPKLKLLPHAK